MMALHFWVNFWPGYLFYDTKICNALSLMQSNANTNTQASHLSYGTVTNAATEGAVHSERIRSLH